eukprot:TRINITY_DN9645_c0_g1_i2.p1 TRINITY_DN9645_c0_g1~~TRINITY_DN9645_c0_g1_i2.p1  ORF type:complete len:562 (+),score=67.46 TRINITY_DN9645_c0_g1_i2:141-1826(+)
MTERHVHAKDLELASIAKLYRLLALRNRLNPLFLKRHFRSRSIRAGNGNHSLDAIMARISSSSCINWTILGSKPLDTSLKLSFLGRKDLHDLDNVPTMSLAQLRRCNQFQLVLLDEKTHETVALSAWLCMQDLSGPSGSAMLRMLDGTASLSVTWSRTPAPSSPHTSRFSLSLSSSLSFHNASFNNHQGPSSTRTISSVESTATSQAPFIPSRAITSSSSATASATPSAGTSTILNTNPGSSLPRRRRHKRRQRVVDTSQSPGETEPPVQRAHMSSQTDDNVNVPRSSSAIDSGMEDETDAQSPLETGQHAPKQQCSVAVQTDHEGVQEPRMAVGKLTWYEIRLFQHHHPGTLLQLELNGNRARCPFCGDLVANPALFPRHINTMHSRLYCQLDEASKEFHLHIAQHQWDESATADEFYLDKRIKARGKLLPLGPPSRQYYHSHSNSNCRQVPEQDSDDDVDACSHVFPSYKLLNETTDVHNSERSVMQLWNAYCFAHPVTSDSDTSAVCLGFISTHAAQLKMCMQATKMHFTNLLHQGCLTRSQLKTLLDTLARHQRPST